MILLGLASVDPIGIAVIPIVLIQKDPLRRAAVFIAGSFSALVGMGLLFTKGLGVLIITFESSHPWVIQVIELVGGLVLLSISLALYLKIRSKKLHVDPPQSLKERLSLGKLQLFGTAVVLVAIQSVLDVVFVITMIRIGQLRLAFTRLLLVIFTYAASALCIQFAVIGAYILTPEKHRERILKKIHNLLEKHAYKLVTSISFSLGVVLLLLAGKIF